LGGYKNEYNGEEDDELVGEEERGDDEEEQELVALEDEEVEVWQDASDDLYPA
jgi:hypothetical protein